MEVLVRSENYLIVSEYEKTYLLRIEDKKKVLIGDFYGNPLCAFISSDEKYCITGGCGFIIYYIREPFIEYEYNTKTAQWVEFYREEENVLWVENIYKSDIEEEMRFIVDPSDYLKGGIYSFNLKTYCLKRLLPE